ncbi:hypothetical protein [Actinoplanes sp. HUAS TT8]|uniref:hypothetical protein n=1 Tax=Actinoplanes sp. HUAS TT8 TaxID=3447453 RepID=UPI003F527045
MIERSKQMRAGLGILGRAAVLLIFVVALIHAAEFTAGTCSRADGAAGGWATAVLFAVMGLLGLLLLGLWRTRGTQVWPGILLGWALAALVTVAVLAAEAAYVRGLPLGC